MPAEISIDAGRDSAASLNEINAFAKTYREHYGEKGEDWREAMDQRAYEEVYREVAKRKALEVLNGESNKADTTTGQPSSETGQVSQVSQVGSTDAEETMRDYLEAYGTAVRAGAITPSIADEESVRAKLGLPPVNEEVRKVWAEENNTRRPITLKGGKEEQQVVVEDEDEDEGETEQ